MAKPFVGVLHLPALPSSARTRDPFDMVLTRAMADARALHDGGCDGIVVENFGDAPFHKGTRNDPVAPDVPAALAVVAREVRVATGLPVGVNCLRNDGIAALGAAVVAGATWVRINVLSGAAVTDQGVIEGEAARVRDYRLRVGFAGEILADLLVKHSAPLAATDPLDAARLAERAGADGLIVTGTRTGAPVDAAFLRDVKAAVGAFPVWIGSGLDPTNAAELWPSCDGAIVGTALKHDGDVRRAVDVARVRALRRVLASISE
jgi:membrane complex biogenesis BtpA family protein